VLLKTLQLLFRRRQALNWMEWFPWTRTSQIRCKYFLLVLLTDVAASSVGNYLRFNVIQRIENGFSYPFWHKFDSFRYNVAWSSVDAFVYGRYSPFISCVHTICVCGCLKELFSWLLCVINFALSSVLFVLNLMRLSSEQCLLQRLCHFTACFTGCQVFNFAVAPGHLN
jgi:hypothetical protein